MSKDFNKLCKLNEILGVYKNGKETDSYCLMLDGVLSTDDSTSVLGKAILGKMILGRGN